MDPRWPTPPARPLALALQQALAQEVLRARQGLSQQGTAAARLLQALAALLSSAHAGALVMAMHHGHALSCPLLRQLHLYQVLELFIQTQYPCSVYLLIFPDFFFSLSQRLVSQDVAFASLFFKVVMQMLTWLESSAVEAGPLNTLLKSLAAQYSHKHRITDGDYPILLFFQQKGPCFVHRNP